MATAADDREGTARADRKVGRPAISRPVSVIDDRKAGLVDDAAGYLPIAVIAHSR